MNVLSSLVKKSVSTSIVSCKCETCGEVFLPDTTTVDFINTSHMFDLAKASVPDEWVVKALKHFESHQDHKMVGKNSNLNVLELGLIGKKDLVFFPPDLSQYFKALNYKLDLEDA